ncbi:hypothetical protein ACG3SL_15950 [Sphingomonas sp. CJ20]
MRSKMYPWLAAATLFAVAGCAAIPEAPRPAPPVPVPTPTPAPPPPAPKLSADWRDWPLTPGGWTYRRDARGSIALFGRGAAEAELSLRCDLAGRRITLSRRGAGVASKADVTVRTTSLLRPLTLMPTGGAAGTLATELPARDSVLDAMGYSRGRFVIEGGGLPTLVVPAWAEILRVTEDCRG